MKIFNLKIMLNKKYNEEKEHYEYEINKLKDKNDNDFIILQNQSKVIEKKLEYSYESKLSSIKSKIKFNKKVLNELEKTLLHINLFDASEYKIYLECYLNLLKEIYNYKF